MTRQAACGERCIPVAWLCNGERECPDGTDEQCGERPPRVWTPRWPLRLCAWLTVPGLVVFPLRGYPEMLGLLDCCRLSVGKPRDVGVGSIIIEMSVEGWLG